MRKNESVATCRRVGPIPFFDNDGNRINGLDFKTALGHVLVSGDGANWVAAANDAVTQASLQYYEFTQAETNYDAIVAVRLQRPGTSGSSTSTASNSLSNSAAAMLVNQYKGQVLVDHAGSRWPIASNTATTFTLIAGTSAPASGSYVVEAYREIDWTERTDMQNVASIAAGSISELSFTSGALAVLGMQLFAGETTGTPTFSRTTFTIASTSSPSSVNDFYNGAIAEVYADTNAANIGMTATVNDYDGGTKQLTFVGTGFPVALTSASKLALARGVRFPPDDTVRAMWDGPGAVLEASATAGDLFRLAISVLACKVTDFQSGTLVFRDIADTKTRWTVVTDPSGRISITRGDLTP